MSKIIPTILTNDLTDLKNKLAQLEGLVDWVQIDIMDNIFVPNISVAVSDLIGLETSANLEAHLMIKNPADSFEACKKAGIKRVIFHLEAVDNVEEIIEKLSEFGFEKGLAINPNTPIEAIKPYLDKLDLVLIMSVNPGFQGQKFIPEVLDKVRELKALAPKLKLSIDGGINAENIKEASESGLDFVSVGSALFTGDDIEGNLKKLIKLGV
jgi:ribulose-phosphate 3-epimerase